MPNIGEIRKGKDLGLKDGYPHQFLACKGCGIVRWVRLIKGKPQNDCCVKCGAIRSGEKSKGRTRIPPKTQKIIDTGVRECNKCHRVLPATLEYFIKNIKLKLGIDAICKECSHTKYLEKQALLGKVEIICSLCGRKELVYNTGKTKSICGGCSQKLSGVQKLPRPNRQKTNSYSPKANSVCKVCGREYPATIKWFRRDKATKSGLQLSKCRKCLSKIRYQKIKSNPKQRINNRISLSINESLNGTKNGHHWETLVGYTIKRLIKHLKKQFKDGMSWSNYGEWHIDHIIPQSAFHFTSPDDIDFKRCWALSNLQPLWGSENSKKGAQILKPFQPSLKIK